MGSRSEHINASLGQVSEPVRVGPQAAREAGAEPVFSQAIKPGLVPVLPRTEGKAKNSPGTSAARQSPMQQVVQADAAGGDSLAQRGRQSDTRPAAGSEQKNTRQEPIKVTGDAPGADETVPPREPPGPPIDRKGNSEGEEPNERRRIFDNVVAYQDWVTNHSLPMYQDDHPVSEYARQLFQRGATVEESEGFTIRVYRGEPNAFCFPNGSIYVSDGLLRLSRTEEGIMYAQEHERGHVTEEHGAKADEYSEVKSPGDIIKDSLRHLGQKRFQEWEADIKAFTAAENRGFNPMGGIELFEDMRALEKGRDIIHGSMVSRILNLRTLTRMRDIATIQDPTQSIPQDIKDRLAPKARMRSTFESFFDNLEERNSQEVRKIINAMNPQTALLVLPEAIAKYRQQKQIQAPNAQGWARAQQEFITELGQKVWVHIAEAFPDNSDMPLTDKQKTFLFHSMLSLAADAQTTTEDQQELFLHPAIKVINVGNTGYPWEKRKISFQEQLYTPEDIEELTAVLNPEVFSKLGMIITNSPEGFVKDLTERILTREMFVDYPNDDDEVFDSDAYVTFAANITNRLAELYHARGAVAFDKEEIYASIIKQAKDTIQESEYQQVRSKAVERLPSIGSYFREKEAVTTLEEQLTILCEEYIEAHQVFTGSFKNEIPINSEFSNMHELGEMFQERFSRFFAQLGDMDESGFLEFLTNYRDKFRESRLWKVYDQDIVVHNNLSGLLFDNCLKFTDSSESNDSINAFIFELKVSSMLSPNNIEIYSAIETTGDRFVKLVQKPEFTYEAYETIYKLIIDELGIDKKSYLPQNSLKERLRLGIYVLLDRAAKENLPKEEFAQLLEKLTTNFDFIHFGTDTSAYTNLKDGKEAQTDEFSQYPKNPVLKNIFSKYDFSIEDNPDLRPLYYLSTYFENVNYSSRLQDVILPRLVEQMSFDEGLAFFKQEIRSGRMLSLRSFEDFTETKARTHDEIKQTKESVIELLSSRESGEALGSLAIGEIMAEFLLDSKAKEEILLAGLSNGVDDKRLKQFLYRKWRRLYNSHLTHDIAEDTNLDSLVGQIYTLNPQAKFLLIRELLTGKDGMLVHEDPEKRVKLFDDFISLYIEPSGEKEQEMLQVVRDVMHEVARTADYDLLYFALAPLLQDRFLVPPQESVPWDTIIAEEVAPYGFSTPHRASLTPAARSSRRPINADDTPTANAVKRINSLIIGKKQRKMLQRHEEAREKYEKYVEALLEGNEQNGTQVKMSVAEFIGEFAQTLGAPGVRFMQALNQFIDLPAELEAVANRSYDKVPGQSKIAADQTLLREWPEGEEELDGLEVRRGGGSLMSTFQTLFRETQQRVAKVLNPNAEFHTEVTYKLLKEVVTKLAQRKPEFEAILPLLDDIRDWIVGDINFTGFLEADQRFKDKHDGFNTGGRYTIKVPTSYAPENKYFIQEEYIEGINLTELDALREQGHDVKAIVSLITRNFFGQIEDGQVHSNIHPGNVRVTPQDEATWLDRNFYLQLNATDKEFLFAMAAGNEDISQMVDQSLTYLATQGAEIDDSKRQRITDRLASINDIEDPTRKILNFSVALRKEGLRFPLRMTLLVQNIYFLDNLAKKVGYTGILEALLG